MKSTGGFEGKTVLIAGASSGIGAALARELSPRGARLVLVARRRQRLEALALECGGGHNPGHLIIEADLTDARQVDAMTKQIAAEAHGLHSLFYCAGIGQWSSFKSTSRAAARRIVEVNLLGAIETVRSCLPLMVGIHGARITLISSVAGLRGMPMGAAYSASKAGLEGLADALRVELRKEGIGVTTVYPSLTRTPFFHHLAQGTAPSLEGKWSQTPEQVARAILRAARKGRRRAFPSFKGRLIVILAKTAPWVLDWLQYRQFLRAERRSGA